MAEKRKALVVDDTAFHRDFLKMFLGFKGYEVTAATDGLEALKACKEGRFDLVFSDIEMPNMNGMEFLRAVKRLPEFTKVPVVMISTLEDAATKQKVTAMGAFHYIIKPFNTQKMDELFAKLGG
jgi:two-component system chemotaxis response regulator CheY